MKYYYDLHLHSCLSPHPLSRAGAPFFSLGRSESALRRGFRSGENARARLPARFGRQARRLPVISKRSST